MCPVSDFGMYVERRVVSGRVLHGGRAVCPRKFCSSRGIQNISILVDILPASAALAKSIDSPMCAVLCGALQQGMLRTVVALGQTDGTSRDQTDVGCNETIQRTRQTALTQHQSCYSARQQ